MSIQDPYSLLVSNGGLKAVNKPEPFKPSHDYEAPTLFASISSEKNLHKKPKGLIDKVGGGGSVHDSLGDGDKVSGEINLNSDVDNAGSESMFGKKRASHTPSANGLPVGGIIEPDGSVSQRDFNKDPRT